MTARAEVVQEARSWAGTKYSHQGRLKGVAVDCAGLVIGVARNLGLVAPDFDVNGYARQPDGHSLMAHCRQWMTEIPIADMQAGDIVVQWFQVDPCHFGFLVPYRHGGLAMIHALQRNDGRGRVVEHRLDPTNMRRVVAAFQLPGVA